MTEYSSRSQLTHPPTINEAKENRRKVLEAVYARRKINYQRYIRKLRDNLNRNKIDASFD